MKNVPQEKEKKRKYNHKTNRMQQWINVKITGILQPIFRSSVFYKVSYQCLKCRHEVVQNHQKSHLKGHLKTIRKKIREQSITGKVLRIVAHMSTVIALHTPCEYVSTTHPLLWGSHYRGRSVRKPHSWGPGT